LRDARVLWNVALQFVSGDDNRSIPTFSITAMQLGEYLLDKL
jgi:hypothetical protein